MQFFKLAAFLAGVTVGGLCAAQSVLTDENRAIAAMTKTLREQSSEWDMPVNVHETEAASQARRIFDEIDDDFPLSDTPTSNPSAEGKILIFASFSLGEEGLEDVFATASETEGAVVVFRGIPYEDQFARSMNEMQALAAKQSPVANVTLNPTLFRKYNVTSVPTMVYMNDDRTESVARVSGLTAPQWLSKAVEQGSTGDLGIKGPVEEISERDLIVVMQEKVAAIDWREKRERAVKRFWEKQQFIDLPRAAAARTRYLDPSIVMNEDLKDGEGNILVAQGTTINPLELRSFTQAVVVFDPTDLRQLAWVRDKVADLNTRHPRVTLIATRFDRSKGWKSYEEITDLFDAPVYKLTPDIAKRWDLEYSPSVITSEHNYFVIEELYEEPLQVAEGA